MSANPDFVPGSTPVTAAGAASAPAPEVVLPPGAWACVACTYVNRRAGARVCELCGTPRAPVGGDGSDTGAGGDAGDGEEDEVAPLVALPTQFPAVDVSIYFDDEDETVTAELPGMAPEDDGVVDVPDPTDDAIALGSQFVGLERKYGFSWMRLLDPVWQGVCAQAGAVGFTPHTQAIMPVNAQWRDSHTPALTAWATLPHIIAMGNMTDFHDQRSRVLRLVNQTFQLATTALRPPATAHRLPSAALRFMATTLRDSATPLATLLYQLTMPLAHDPIQPAGQAPPSTRGSGDAGPVVVATTTTTGGDGASSRWAAPSSRPSEEEGAAWEWTHMAGLRYATAYQAHALAVRWLTVATMVDDAMREGGCPGVAGEACLASAASALLRHGVIDNALGGGKEAPLEPAFPLPTLDAASAGVTPELMSFTTIAAHMFTPNPTSGRGSSRRHTKKTPLHLSGWAHFFPFARPPVPVGSSATLVGASMAERQVEEEEGLPAPALCRAAGTAAGLALVAAWVSVRCRDQPPVTYAQVHAWCHGTPGTPPSINHARITRALHSPHLAALLKLRDAMSCAPHMAPRAVVDGVAGSQGASALLPDHEPDWAEGVRTALRAVLSDPSGIPATPYEVTVTGLPRCLLLFLAVTWAPLLAQHGWPSAALASERAKRIDLVRQVASAAPQPWMALARASGSAGVLWAYMRHGDVAALDAHSMPCDAHDVLLTTGGHAIVPVTPLNSCTTSPSPLVEVAITTMGGTEIGGNGILPTLGRDALAHTQTYPAANAFSTMLTAASGSLAIRLAPHHDDVALQLLGLAPADLPRVLTWRHKGRRVWAGGKGGRGDDDELDEEECGSGKVGMEFPALPVLWESTVPHAAWVAGTATLGDLHSQLWCAVRSNWEGLKTSLANHLSQTEATVAGATAPPTVSTRTRSSSWTSVIPSSLAPAPSSAAGGAHEYEATAAGEEYGSGGVAGEWEAAGVVGGRGPGRLFMAHAATTSTVCQYFQSGYCRDGADCPNLHVTLAGVKEVVVPESDTEHEAVGGAGGVSGRGPTSTIAAFTGSKHLPRSGARTKTRAVKSKPVALGCLLCRAAATATASREGEGSALATHAGATGTMPDPASIPLAPPAAASEMWQCGVCTLDNAADATVCALCETVRPSLLDAVSSSPSMGMPSLAGEGEGSAPSAPASTTPALPIIHGLPAAASRASSTAGAAWAGRTYDVTSLLHHMQTMHTDRFDEAMAAMATVMKEAGVGADGSTIADAFTSLFPPPTAEGGDDIRHTATVPAPFTAAAPPAFHLAHASPARAAPAPPGGYAPLPVPHSSAPGNTAWPPPTSATPVPHDDLVSSPDFDPSTMLPRAVDGDDEDDGSYVPYPTGEEGGDTSGGMPPHPGYAPPRGRGYVRDMPLEDVLDRLAHYDLSLPPPSVEEEVALRHQGLQPTLDDERAPSTAAALAEHHCRLSALAVDLSTISYVDGLDEIGSERHAVWVRPRPATVASSQSVAPSTSVHPIMAASVAATASLQGAGAGEHGEGSVDAAHHHVATPAVPPDVTAPHAWLSPYDAWLMGKKGAGDVGTPAFPLPPDASRTCCDHIRSTRPVALRVGRGPDAIARAAGTAQTGGVGGRAWSGAPPVTVGERVMLGRSLQRIGERDPPTLPPRPSKGGGGSGRGGGGAAMPARASSLPAMVGGMDLATGAASADAKARAVAAVRARNLRVAQAASTSIRGGASGPAPTGSGDVAPAALPPAIPPPPPVPTAAPRAATTSASSVAAVPLEAAAILSTGGLSDGRGGMTLLRLDSSTLPAPAHDTSATDAASAGGTVSATRASPPGVGGESGDVGSVPPAPTHPPLLYSAVSLAGGSTTSLPATPDTRSIAAPAATATVPAPSLPGGGKLESHGFTASKGASTDTAFPYTEATILAMRAMLRAMDTIAIRGLWFALYDQEGHGYSHDGTASPCYVCVYGPRLYDHFVLERFRAPLASMLPPSHHGASGGDTGKDEGVRWFAHTSEWYRHGSTSAWDRSYSVVWGTLGPHPSQRPPVWLPACGDGTRPGVDVLPAVAAQWPVVVGAPPPPATMVPVISDIFDTGVLSPHRRPALIYPAGRPLLPFAGPAAGDPATTAIAHVVTEMNALAHCTSPRHRFKTTDSFLTPATMAARWMVMSVARPLPPPGLRGASDAAPLYHPRLTHWFGRVLEDPFAMLQHASAYAACQPHYLVVTLLRQVAALAAVPAMTVAEGAGIHGFTLLHHALPYRSRLAYFHLTAFGLHHAAVEVANHVRTANRSSTAHLGEAALVPESEQDIDRGGPAETVALTERGMSVVRQKAVVSRQHMWTSVLRLLGPASYHLRAPALKPAAFAASAGSGMGGGKGSPRPRTPEAQGRGCGDVRDDVSTPTPALPTTVSFTPMHTAGGASPVPGLASRDDGRGEGWDKGQGSIVAAAATALAASGKPVVTVVPASGGAVAMHPASPSLLQVTLDGHTCAGRRTLRLLHAVELAETTGLLPSAAGEVGVQFSHEAGHGLGPTIEFFTLACKETRRQVVIPAPGEVAPPTPTTVTGGVGGGAGIDAGTGMATAPAAPSPAGPCLSLWYVSDRVGDGLDAAGNGLHHLHPMPILTAPVLTRNVPHTPPCLVCVPSEAQVTLLHRFEVMGRVAARALRDKRLLDLPLSLPFLKAIMRAEQPVQPHALSPSPESVLDMHDVALVNADVGKSLAYLQSLVVQRDALVARWRETTAPTPSPTCHEEERRGLSSAWLALHTTVASLCLDFTLPGCEDTTLTLLPWPSHMATDPSTPATGVEAVTLAEYARRVHERTAPTPLPEVDAGVAEALDLSPLVPHGNGVEVTLANLHVYVEGVVRTLVGEGIQPAADAFARGFAYFAPAGVSMLSLFTLPELDCMFGGGDAVGKDELWASEAISPHITTTHGYTSTSQPVRDLLTVLQSFNLVERRLFLRFLTGSPRLPIGGFAALSPPLTIVRSAPLGGVGVDELLPTCSTCHVYLKLPPYTSATILQARLLVAIHEGQDVFAFD